MPSNYYNVHASQLAKQYRSLSFADVHADWLDLLDSHFSSDAHMVFLDVGAGSGRDARFLAHRFPHSRVVAVEPASQLAALGREYTQGAAVDWLEDSLPSLPKLCDTTQTFHLALLSAVWMHLSQHCRAEAMKTLAQLLKPNGLLVLSLRHGQSEQDIQERRMFHVTATEAIALAAHHNLKLLRQCTNNNDQLGRSHVHWETLVFCREEQNAR